MDARRVAITGLGVLSPVGSSKKAFWDSLTGARSGFAAVSSFDTAGFRTRVGAEVKDFSPREAFAYALAAAKAALEDAGLRLSAIDLDKAGVALGTTSGEMRKIEEMMDRRRANPASDLGAEAFPFSPAGIPAKVARALGFRGPNVMLTTACSAGNGALAYAWEKIGSGRAEVMAAGGVDVFNRLNFAGFNKLLAVAPETCAPFSKDRKGLIPGEGCAVLILEEYEAARRRGARIYAEMAGYGLSSDASHVTLPDVDGICRAIAACLAEAGIGPEEVDYISAHGTGTPANDRLETAAIKKAFGERSRAIPVSSIKSMVGHAMGAASALEAAACCLALETGVLPPTVNFTGQDPECDLDYVPNAARETHPAVVLSNAFAFGGSNSVIALCKAGAPGLRRSRSADARVVITGLGLVREEEPLALAEALLPDKDLSFIDRPMAFALCAAKRALDDARLEAGSLGDEGGIILDSAGELGSLFQFYEDLAGDGPSAVEPRLFPNILANAAASRAAIVFGLRLLNLSLAGSFPGGESALALAFDLLKRTGRGTILAGGVDCGAFVMSVETLDGARQRGARVYAEVAGYQESFDPAAVEKRGPGCFCLAEALQRAAPVYNARGQWGGRIRFEFSNKT